MLDLHRIEIPEEYGGGWVDIKPKRSWKDSNRIAGGGFHLRPGITADELKAAEDSGRVGDVMELDTHGRLSTPLETAIVATSEGLRREGMSIRAWLDSDELDEDVGDHLVRAITEYYEARARSTEERKT